MEIFLHTYHLIKIKFTENVKFVYMTELFFYRKYVTLQGFRSVAYHFFKVERLRTNNFNKTNDYERHFWSLATDGSRYAYCVLRTADCHMSGFFAD